MNIFTARIKFKFIQTVSLVITVLLFTGCASTTVDGDVYDPLEATNRNIYKFNDGLDKLILKPVATGYQKLPSPIQTGTHNFFSNLNDVLVIFNDILQLKGQQFASDSLRFSFNSTFGIFGLIDIATPMGLPKNHENFAETLGYWGVASGPYIVLPFFGPSSLRDAPSLVVDYFMHPISLVSSSSLVAALASVRAVEVRSKLLKATELQEALALDPYIFSRESYFQWRQNRIYDGEPPTVTIENFEDSEDLNNFEGF